VSIGAASCLTDADQGPSKDFGIELLRQRDATTVCFACDSTAKRLLEVCDGRGAFNLDGNCVGLAWLAGEMFATEALAG
jgi:hypothetical protein